MTRYASDPVCDAFAALEAHAMDCGYLVAVWPHHEPHEHPVKVDHAAATLNIFEPDTATAETDQAVLDLMADAVAAIEAHGTDR